MHGARAAVERSGIRERLAIAHKEARLGKRGGARSEARELHGSGCGPSEPDAEDEIPLVKLDRALRFTRILVHHDERGAVREDVATCRDVRQRI